MPQMKKTQAPIVLIIFMLLCVFEVNAQTDHQKIVKYFSKHYEKAKIVGMQVASIGNGELVWHGSFGVKEYNTTDSINDSTLFMMASCTKPVTSLGIMKLYDQGKLDLDDDINNYLPFQISNPNYPQEKITFRMLLAHTSSLRDNWIVYDSLYTLPEGGDSPLELQQFIRDYFTEGGEFYSSTENFAVEKPGRSYHYCNMGYALLGVLLEQISGMSFSEYMHKEIFQPLQMNNSYWFLKEIPHKNIAHPHEVAPVTGPGVLNHYGFPSFPDGQLRTTATDYAQILKLMINRGKVNETTFLKEETIDEYLKIQYPEIAKFQAIAWNYNEFDAFLYKLVAPRYIFARRLPGHSGYDPGIDTYITFDPKKKTGIIIFLNSEIIQFKGVRIYHQMIKKLFKEGKKYSSSFQASSEAVGPLPPISEGLQLIP
jgi:CubicO group peptidase (beta-lactamase class C family)